MFWALVYQIIAKVKVLQVWLVPVQSYFLLMIDSGKE